MRCIIGNRYYSTIEGSSVHITRSVSDPVPTCTLNLSDVNSSLNPQEGQEVFVIDDQVYPNPTWNLWLNPSLNPYTTFTGGINVGTSLSQNTGGGVIVTFPGAASGSQGGLVQLSGIGPMGLTIGQQYCFSVTTSGAPATNVECVLSVQWTDAAGNIVSTDTKTINPLLATSTRQSMLTTMPAGAVYANPRFYAQATASSNTSVITFTQVQFEPVWIPTLSYPTAWCGPNQTNCQQLPLGYYIRQYRKFAGFVTHKHALDYHGNVRTWAINCVGYAWLMGTFLANDTFSSKTDAQIITSLLGKYVVNSSSPNPNVLGLSLCTTTNVVTGISNISSKQYNWDDLRTAFDGLCGMSGFYWTIDYYWNFIYAPPGYYNQGIGLICDNSSTPDNVTTFPAYNFSAEGDFTQPGSTILVLGNGSNVAEVVDPAQIQNLGFTTGYFLPTGTSWMRKVNDSTLASTTDATTRGLEELLLYDFPRKIYHLTTNQELITGESVQLTSATENLSAATLLVQQVTANWIGTNETLDDYWEYKADLGATNRAATNMISRIFRTTQTGTSAPAIATTTEAIIENPINIVEAIATTSVSSNYLTTLQGDGPVAVYALNEITGTIADDTGGNAYQGTLNGGITQGTTGLLVDAADSSKTAWTFNGSTGYVSLPTTLIPTGSGHAWSLEAWIKINSLPASNAFMAIVAIGTNANLQSAQIKLHNNGGTQRFLLSTFNGDIEAGTPATGTTYHMVGTYDGTSTRLYVNNSLIAGPTAFTVSLGTAYASIGADGASGSVIDFFNGVIQYAAIYNVALSSTQISNHYHAGGF